MGTEEDTEGERKDGVRTNISEVLRRRPETRAESTISSRLVIISAAERTGGLPCVDLGVGEEVAGTGAEEERQRLDEGQVRTKISVFVGASGDTCRINDFD